MTSVHTRVRWLIPAPSLNALSGGSRMGRIGGDLGPLREEHAASTVLITSTVPPSPITTSWSHMLSLRHTSAINCATSNASGPFFFLWTDLEQNHNTEFLGTYILEKEELFCFWPGVTHEGRNHWPWILDSIKPYFNLLPNPEKEVFKSKTLARMKRSFFLVNLLWWPSGNYLCLEWTH